MAIRAWHPDLGGTSTPGVGEADILLTPIATTVPGGVNNVGGANTVFASNITALDDLRHYWGLYFQDDWKANSKLTINMGLRWEYFGGLADPSGKQAGLTLTSGTPQYVLPSSQKNAPLSPAFTALLAKDNIQLNHIGSNSLFTTPKNNFAPRTRLGLPDHAQACSAGCLRNLLRGFREHRRSARSRLQLSLGL